MTPIKITVKKTAGSFSVRFQLSEWMRPGIACFIAISLDPLEGCAVVPYLRHREGSTVFLPFRADRIFAVKIQAESGVRNWVRNWEQFQWSEAREADAAFLYELKNDALILQAPRAIHIAAWVKDLAAHDGWGCMMPDTLNGQPEMVSDAALTGEACERVCIYQLFPRLFSNVNETRKLNGTLIENGVGKFAEMNEAALRSLRDELGVTHLWLAGVLAQATGTDYSAIGKPADDYDLLKGIAGSPYAIKDYGDVCPDYACDPERRLEEFSDLIHRARSQGLRVMIDFVPNHVARSHAEDRFRFGDGDDAGCFFSPENNFFWLQADSPGGGPPLRLPAVKDGQWISPTCRALGEGDGIFPPEMERGRVTGNNAATWSPGPQDWYETVKLNYGYDFTTGRRAYPHSGRPELTIPNTWWKMDAVLAHWQEIGVDGFRCDMAHMVPPEFWAWAIARARQRQPGVYFTAEAYNNDPMKVEGAYDLVAHFKNVTIELLNAGFDSVYDDPAYKVLKKIYDGPAWANDLDEVLNAQCPYVFHRSLRYAENHDEVRLASKGNWGGIGMDVGRAVSGVLYGISRGPVLLYSGQEVGEPAEGAEGFGGDDGRTSIFDYWCIPELARWVNGHRYDGGRLSAEQKALRAYYGRLLKTCREPAFCEGDFFPLNGANWENPDFGRLGESASGHWFYAYFRIAKKSRYLVASNLHPSERMHGIRIELGKEAKAALGNDGVLYFSDKVGGLPPFSLPVSVVRDEGISLPPLPALTSAYFEITGC